MPETPVARSPMAQVSPVEPANGWEISRRQSSAPLRLADLSQLTKLGVKSQEPPFNVPYGRSTRVNDWLIVGSGPGEWTLLGPIGETTEVVTSGFAAVFDLTHGRALMRLTGEKAPSVLEKLCSIDLAAHMCPNGAAFRAAVASVVTDVVRDDVYGTKSYLLHCERSSGQFLFDSVLDAGTEFDIDIDGFSWLQMGGRG